MQERRQSYRDSITRVLDEKDEYEQSVVEVRADQTDIHPRGGGGGVLMCALVCCDKIRL